MMFIYSLKVLRKANEALLADFSNATIDWGRY
jgi:hypothetical protein